MERLHEKRVSRGVQATSPRPGHEAATVPHARQLVTDFGDLVLISYVEDADPDLNRKLGALADAEIRKRQRAGVTFRVTFRDRTSKDKPHNAKLVDGAPRAHQRGAA